MLFAGGPTVVLHDQSPFFFVREYREMGFNFIRGMLNIVTNGVIYVSAARGINNQRMRDYGHCVGFRNNAEAACERNEKSSGKGKSCGIVAAGFYEEN